MNDKVRRSTSAAAIVFVVVSGILGGCGILQVSLESSPSPTVTFVSEPPSSASLAASATPQETRSPNVPLSTPTPSPLWIEVSLDLNAPGIAAYLDPMRNVCLINVFTGESSCITDDSQTSSEGPYSNPWVDYGSPLWSPSGCKLAFRQQLHLPNGGGTEESLWVFDCGSSERQRLAANVGSLDFDWLPGGEGLVYDKPVDLPPPLGGGNSEGLWQVLVHSRETKELVAPARGYPLTNPRVSPNGRYVGFEEVVEPEAGGYFAYFDTQTTQYVAWEKVAGNYDWMRDSSGLISDLLSYVPSDPNSIWILELASQEESLLTNPPHPSWACFAPHVSPNGIQVAFPCWDTKTGERGAWVVDIQGKGLRRIAPGIPAVDLAWAPTSDSLLLETSSSNGGEIHWAHLESGESRLLTYGSSPSWRP